MVLPAPLHDGKETQPTEDTRERLSDLGDGSPIPDIDDDHVDQAAVRRVIRKLDAR